jgi:thiol-disulfide isomerase/thioredoxin
LQNFETNIKAPVLNLGAMRATVGRIPIAGPIISSVATQMVNEELSKVQIIGDGSSKDASVEPVAIRDLCQTLMKPDTLWMKNGTFLNPLQLDDVQIFIFYFSAHWCPPCRKFTPILAKQFEIHRNQSSSSKSCVIFVSRDRTQQEQMDYMKECHGDWPAVPCQSDLQPKLNSAFQIEGNSYL